MATIDSDGQFDPADLSRLVEPVAANRTDFQPGETIEPIYLRPTEFVKAPPPRKL